MGELKVCPICGCKADMSYNVKKKHQVFCSNEECYMNGILIEGMETEEQAIEKWNERRDE